MGVWPWRRASRSSEAPAFSFEINLLPKVLRITWLAGRRWAVQSLCRCGAGGNSGVGREFTGARRHELRQDRTAYVATTGSAAETGRVAGHCGWCGGFLPGVEGRGKMCRGFDQEPGCAVDSVCSAVTGASRRWSTCRARSCRAGHT